MTDALAYYRELSASMCVPRTPHGAPSAIVFLSAEGDPLGLDAAEPGVCELFDIEPTDATPGTPAHAAFAPAGAHTPTAATEPAADAEFWTETLATLSKPPPLKRPRFYDYVDRELASVQ